MERLKTSLRAEWEDYRDNTLILQDADELARRAARRHFMAGAATILQILADVSGGAEDVLPAIQVATADRLRREICHYAGDLLRGRA